MIRYDSCMGCGACANICPMNCITMTAGENGFLRPKVDESKCIRCGKCQDVCIMNHDMAHFEDMKEAYLFINKDQYDRNLSSSGGFVKALADYIIERKNGVCFGAAFDRDLSVHHIAIDKKEDVYAILTSKYVQSKTEMTYREVKALLEKERWVLYTGTPCQIAGLMSFLGNKTYETLVTVDIFCHGVPSQELWESYLQEYYGNEEIRYVQFRDKTFGWWNRRFRIQFAHNEMSSAYRPPTDDYLKLFLNSISINEKCMDCKYRQEKRLSDFYIGDAWNINKIKQNMDDNRGITTVVTNTEKAKVILDCLAENNHVFSVSLEDAVFGRPELFQKKRETEERKAFWKNYEKGIKTAVKETGI
ncbi:MAG: Coenzyme F420 hydrogenase/dehydrogenase, beta subunit C-terminal domain [Lachnospiraceae bacterium]|nr:Coenzyme F420 hydrogenase/dehydrogenase, beta subunit C-terminal domain [Lachnospiraceae bacterium]